MSKALRAINIWMKATCGFPYLTAGKWNYLSASNSRLVGCAYPDGNYSAHIQVGIKWIGEHKSNYNFEIQAVIPMTSEEKAMEMEPCVIHQKYSWIFQYLIVSSPFAKQELTESFWIIKTQQEQKQQYLFSYWQYEKYYNIYAPISNLPFNEMLSQMGHLILMIFGQTRGFNRCIRFCTLKKKKKDFALWWCFFVAFLAIRPLHWFVNGQSERKTAQYFRLC